MTDIKQVSDWALTIAAEAAGSKLHHYERMADDNRLAQSIEAHARAIEQHEAFRQEVSERDERLGEALYGLSARLLLTGFFENKDDHAAYERVVEAFGKPFILPKPDPLVGAVTDVWPASCDEHVNELRAAIEKRGGKIVWGEG